MPNPKERLIFPLDMTDRRQVWHYLELLRDEVGLFKVGWELFLAAGPDILLDLVDNLGPSRCFLDLKLYDIPHTLRGAIHNIVPEVALITIHCDLGPGALQALFHDRRGGFKVLAVTLLTSLSGKDLGALGYAPQYVADPTQLVLLRARLAQAAGCHGVICSGWEVQTVKEACGPDFLAVCPGIRPTWAAVPGDDQRRVATPFEAMKNGADYIVVGRPIRAAADPVAAARRVAAEMAEGLAARPS